MNAFEITMVSLIALGIAFRVGFEIGRWAERKNKEQE